MIDEDDFFDNNVITQNEFQIENENQISEINLNPNGTKNKTTEICKPFLNDHYYFDDLTNNLNNDMKKCAIKSEMLNNLKKKRKKSLRKRSQIGNNESSKKSTKFEQSNEIEDVK